ncbi:MAG: LON peptidase substrate-binding domain-containing protein [Cyclobacteriaceae bacterium]|jgi:hypothetical protein|nr:LON peptidase substrate-binding domain-containing protein [Cyclobacteriaceae bacterium]
MTDFVSIPMFPLSIFPLPGEMVPLHIFEPRYRQLLEDAESRDFSFGIYFNHKSNTEKLGSLVKLESVIKRYKTGESDIIVRCIDIFTMDKLFRTYKDKLYPGGLVACRQLDIHKPMSEKLKSHFDEYHQSLKIAKNDAHNSMYDVANELGFDFAERLRFVNYSESQQESFLISRIKYHVQLLTHVEKARDVFHLN